MGNSKLKRQNRALENKCNFYKNNFFAETPLTFSGKSINLSPLTQDALFTQNSEALNPLDKQPPNAYQKVPTSVRIHIDEPSDKTTITRVNPPSKKQIGMFVALTIITIYTQGIELGRGDSGPVLGEDGALRVMTNEEVCASGWIFEQICVRPWQSFWVFKQVLLVFYFVVCFLFFKKYF